MKRNGGIIGPLTSFKLGENISGMYDTYDVHNYRNLDVWSYTPSVSLSESTTSLNETSNANLDITVNAEGFADGTELYWTINQVSGTVISEDFLDSYTGTFTLSGDVSSSSGEVNIVISPDGTPDGTDQFNVQIRTGSTSGPIIATSATITISDTSTEPPTGEDIMTSFWSIGEFQNNDGASDTSSNYSVSEVQQAYTGTGRLYLIHKITGVTSYLNDAPIACIQVLNPSGTAINEQWWFGLSGNGQGWTTHTSEYSFGAVGAGVNITPDQAAAYGGFIDVINGATADRFTLASSTGSSSTGAVGGISEPTGPMTLGEKTMPQNGSTYYMYRETSGGTTPYCAFCRSPSRTWLAGEIIRIAYIIGNASSSNYYRPTDTLFVGISAN